MSKSEPTQFGCPALCGWGPFVAIYLGIEYLMAEGTGRRWGRCAGRERVQGRGKSSCTRSHDFLVATSPTVIGSIECVVL